MSGEFICRVLLVGLGATLTMDLWALVQKYVLRIPPLNYGLVGRWLLWMSRGRFRHNTIVTSPAIGGENLAGWLAHYLIGLAFAFIPAGLAGIEWYSQPTPGVALATGLLTLALPLGIMQPAFGFGIAAAKTPCHGKARLMSLLAHLMFGAGIYLVAKAINSFRY